MALERAREYELRQRQFEQQAVRFYHLAHHLLMTEGGKFTHNLSVVYPRPVSEDGMGGGIRFEQSVRKLPYVVFGAEIEDRNGEVTTVFLSSTAFSKRDFKRTRPEIHARKLYEVSMEYFPTFDLRVVPGRFTLDYLMNERVPVLEFDVGNTDPNDNRISVYGKDLLVNSQFNAAVAPDAFEEFDELVGLTKLLSADPDSYRKIYPKPKSAKLDKAHA